MVPFDMGAGLYRDWCALGASATLEAIPALEHIVGIWLGPPNGIRWLTDRLAGGETPTGCREIGRGCPPGLVLAKLGRSAPAQNGGSGPSGPPEEDRS